MHAPCRLLVYKWPYSITPVEKVVAKWHTNWVVTAFCRVRRPPPARRAMANDCSEGSTGSMTTHSTRRPLPERPPCWQLSAVKQGNPFSVAVKISQCLLRFALMAFNEVEVLKLEIDYMYSNGSFNDRTISFSYDPVFQFCYKIHTCRSTLYNYLYSPIAFSRNTWPWPNNNHKHLWDKEILPLLLQVAAKNVSSTALHVNTW